VKVSRRLLDEVIAHARAEAPRECCGMIAGRDGEAVAVHRVRNVAANPKTAYHMEPREQLRVMDAIDEGGLEIAALYHSHPRTEPVPSQTDINLAGMLADHVFLIVGLGGSEPDVRAFRIVDGAVAEAALEVEDAAPLDA
jgi:proteasome lid subunit RPN8/RPN11